MVQKAELGLREWLTSSELKSGERLPSERSLAKKLGFHHYALNRAMSRLIAAGFVRRDGYKLYLEEEQPLAGESCSCDLVVARRSVNLPGYRKVAREMGIKLTVHTWTSNEEAVSVLSQLKPDELQTVVFDPPASQAVSAWTPQVTHLAGRGVPVVIVGKSVDGFSSVVCDYRRSLQLAIAHLMEFSHEQLAFLSEYQLRSSDVPDDWAKVCRENRLPASAGRIKRHRGFQFLRDDAREIANLFEGDWRKVTALVVSQGAENALPHLLEELARRHRHVPRDLSVICLEDSKILSTCTPPITVTAFDMSVLQEAAFHFAQRAARRLKSRMVQPPPFSICIGPQLLLRESTIALASRSRRQAVPRQAPVRENREQPVFADSARDLDLLAQRPYPLVSMVGKTRFLPLDLSSQVNRPLNFRRGWLGDLPLKDFSPGEHTVHGVPFQILGGSSRSDRGAIVFRSAINAKGSALELPVTLILPINRKAKAIYILHGCSYAKFLQPFAVYDFHHRKALIESVPLVTLGQPPPDHNPQDVSGDIAKANIQDWWPDFPHVDFPHARMVPILQTDEEHAHLRHVYLYTLEWVNPTPEIAVSSLKITVDPVHSTTLGILAVSILGP